MLIRLTPAVKALMIICFAAFIVQQTADLYMGGNFLGWFGLVPSSFALGHRFWQIITYAFLHSDVMHLFFNLMMLAFIGGELEHFWGTAAFLKYYFFCLVTAGGSYLLLQFFVAKGWGGAAVPMIGASGAIYGLLVAYGLIFSERVLLFMMLFPMKAKHFIWVLAAIEFMSTVFSGRGGLASIAHIGGMAGGLGYLWGRSAWIVQRRRRAAGQAASLKEKKKKAAEHLRLVINNDKSEPDQDENPKIWH